MYCIPTVSIIDEDEVSVYGQNTLANPSHKPKDGKSEIFGISFFVTSILIGNSISSH